MSDTSAPTPAPEPSPRRREDLPPAARRALEEAEARRAAEEKERRPEEVNGRGGAEPTRFGDWEKNGIISDF
ncbi:DUF1674 domain-containing protein [Aureimonas sp. Leaf324]|uniref:DUF1674 domain-containing protein n=1 Tax=Aureimonas sp. Leaf324 TaxID=1736336 RepID=UPI0006F2D3DE|nr:DUF1674 domain-containing protein [Aureimonas sp. Leaf324]KQQ89580.1 dihydrodipicolinate reductase [Aureimonas sp. Leaf324]